MSSHLHTLTKYNYWANERICRFIAEAGESKADQELISSFPTIRKTVYHTWDAQEIWMKRMLGEQTQKWPSADFTGTLQEALSLFSESSADFVRFTEKLTANDHLRVVEYHAINGTAYHNTVEEIIMHAMNHGTYHRGQIITMLRNAGFTNVQSTDLIRFHSEQIK